MSFNRELVYRDIDMNGNTLSNAKPLILTEHPTTVGLFVGFEYYNISNNMKYIWTGDSWEDYKGPQGNTGIKGDKGEKGEKGDTGEAPDTSQFATKSELKTVADTLPVLQSEIETLTEADILIGNAITSLTTKVGELEKANGEFALKLANIESRLSALESAGA